MGIIKLKSVRQKNLFGFLLVLLLMIILSIFTIESMKKIHRDTDHIMQEQLPLLMLEWGGSRLRKRINEWFYSYG